MPTATSQRQLLSIKEASSWASELLQRKVSEANISYLIQYGRVKKIGENGSILVDLNDLKKYYDSYNSKHEVMTTGRAGSMEKPLEGAN